MTSDLVPPALSLGTVVLTLGARKARRVDYLNLCLMRHQFGNWGLVSDEDRAANDKAMKDGGRILSAYPIDPDKPCKGWGENTLWIITEADRSVTTILLPEEY